MDASTDTLLLVHQPPQPPPLPPHHHTNDIINNNNTSNNNNNNTIQPSPSSHLTIVNTSPTKYHQYLHHHLRLLQQQQQQNDINLYNSEWKDTINILRMSPSAVSSLNTTLPTEPQSPTKPMEITNEKLTHTHDNHNNTNINNNNHNLQNSFTNKTSTPMGYKRDDYVKVETVSIASSNSSSSTIGPTHVPHIKNWVIFATMINDVTGKDKLAKIGQYLLRLLLHHANKTQTYLSDDKFINIDIINARYNDRTKQLNLIKNFIKHPRDFIKIVTILICSILNQKFSGVITGLSMYRQLLRFGKSPFKVRDLFINLSRNLSLINGVPKLNDSFFNKKTLGQVFSIYYSIHDESLLLYKLGVLSSKSYKKWASTHESRGWYLETWLAMYNAIEKLNGLTKQEMDIKISIEVRNKAKILSRQLLGVNPNLVSAASTGSNGTTATPTQDDLEQLAEIKFKKQNCWLDIYKNLADLAFNSYTVFNIPLPFDTWQIWMGIFAAFLSTSKIYRETKKKLIEKEMSKVKFD